MPLSKEAAQGVHLVTERTPIGPTVTGGPGSQGDMAFKDCLIIIIGAWAVLFLLTYSLRTHNI